MTKELSIAQQSRLRKLLGESSHPDKIDDFLMGCGISHLFCKSPAQTFLPRFA